MKKDCAHARKLLPRYLRGQVFKVDQIRIERHLKACPVCRSEFDALRRAEETKRFLNELTPPEGVGQRIKVGIVALTRLKKILYRPLWIAGLAVIAFALQHYLMVPRQPDLELESIVKTAPSGTNAPVTVPAATVISVAAATAPTSTARLAAPRPAAAEVREAEPLLVTVSTENEKAAIRLMNEVMRGHSQLRKKKFSDTVREISGSLTSKELLTFFARIEPAGRASYNRRRFESFPALQPIPFVMKLKAAPRPAKPSGSETPPADKPAPQQ